MSELILQLRELTIFQVLGVLSIFTLIHLGLHLIGMFYKCAHDMTVSISTFVTIILLYLLYSIIMYIEFKLFGTNDTFYGMCIWFIYISGFMGCATLIAGITNVSYANFY